MVMVKNGYWIDIKELLHKEIYKLKIKGVCLSY